MAELVYDAVQVPQLDSVPHFPGWGDDRPAPVPEWDGGPARARANCPTRASSTRDDYTASRDERTGQEIRVLLVDDHLSFRQPLAFMLMREPDLIIIGQAGSVAEARPLLPEADIALIDLDLPDGEGTDLIRDLHAVNSRATALVLTSDSSDLATARAVAAGASGVMHKTRPVSEIMDAIRRVHAGESLVPVREMMEMLRFLARQREQDRTVRATIARLTPREREVLHALVSGKTTNRDLADALFISPKTAGHHVDNIMAKMGVNSRVAAVALATREGLT